MDFIIARSFNSLYIFLDIAWLLLFTLILLFSRRYLAILAGLAGCVIYFAVDYGIFYHLLGTREVTGGDPLWVLLWLSISYGLTNFAWIWLLLDRDGRPAIEALVDPAAAVDSWAGPRPTAVQRKKFPSLLIRWLEVRVLQGAL